MQFDNKLQLVLGRTLFRSNSMDIYCLNGKQILIDSAAGDENGTRETITSSMYKQFLAKMTLPERVNVLDFGANGGGFPLLLELNGLLIRKLACVEFNPNTFSRMRFNIERNIPAEFVGFNAAVCGEKQEFDFILGSGGTSDSIYADQKGAGRQFKIQGLTFDEIYTTAFGEERVDICKMDVEGAEYDICATGAHQFLRNCGYLIIEIHKHPGKEKTFVIEELTRLGFTEIAHDTEMAHGAEFHYDVFLFKNTGVVAV